MFCLRAEKKEYPRNAVFRRQKGSRGFFAPFFRKKGRFDMYENWKIQTGKFLTAQTISLFGSVLVQYAMVWYLTLHTGSGKVLTFSTICGFLPQVLISLFAGTWLDRYNRKKRQIKIPGNSGVNRSVYARLPGKLRCRWPDSNRHGVNRLILSFGDNPEPATL